jgi:hypothetical protein
MLPEKLIEQIRAHLNFVRQIHTNDLAEGFTASLPDAIGTKDPNAGKQWGLAVPLPGQEPPKEPSLRAFFQP